MATETPNPRTRGLDRISTLELVQLINAEDSRIAGLVNKALPEIARAIDGIAARMDRGGRRQRGREINRSDARFDSFQVAVEPVAGAVRLTIHTLKSSDIGDCQ